MRIYKMIRIVFLALFYLGSYKGTLAQQKIDRILTDKVDSEIQELMDNGDIPGLSVILIEGSKHIIKNYGYANLKDGRRVDSNTLFELGSCSKAFTALAVEKLVVEKKIALDDSMTDYLPWLHVYYKEKEAPITIGQLLHHTSGIPWNTISKIPQTSAADALENTVKQLQNQELASTPGTEYEYATINYDILALIVQKVSGTPFEEYLQHNIIDQLHLASTSIGKPVDPFQMATGYKIGFFMPMEYDAPRFKGNNAAGYVISNAQDVAVWLKFQMGQIQSPLYHMAEMTHQRDETVPLHGMNAYASGWEVAFDGTGEINHTGLNPNFTSYIGFRKKDQIGVAVLANSNSSFTPYIGNKLMKMLAGEKLENTINPNDGTDKVFSIVSIILLIYILVVIGYFVSMLVDLKKRHRKYKALTFQGVKKYFWALCAVAPFLYGLYLFPEAIVGFSWQSIVVWSPQSFKILMVLIVSSLSITYLVYFISLFFVSNNELKTMLPQVLLMSILSGLANMTVIVLVTSSLNSDVELKYMVFYFGLTLGIYLLGSRFVQTKLTIYSRKLTYDLRVRLIDKVFSTSYQNFEKMDRGRVYTSLNDDVGTIGSSIDKFVMLFANIFTVTAAFLYLATIALWATVLTLLLLVTLALIYFYVSNSSNKYFEQARDSRNVFMRLINGMIDGFKELSIRFNKKIEYKNDMTTSANEYREKITTANLRFVNAFLIGESFLIILLGTIAFAIPEWFPHIQSYTIMSFVILLVYLIGPINGILGTVPLIMELKIAYNRIQQFLLEIPAYLDLKVIPELTSEKVTSIKANGISYKYNTEDDLDVFGIGPIDLEVKAGEILFIIGGNGSGKTTLAKLLTGLYESNAGSIMINNKIVTNAQLSEYYSTVFSPPHLFEKLYDIDTKVKSDDVIKYLDLLNLEEKVTITDNKYSTINLSGGQRKRLALLQCYMEDSPIYLFDEWAADQDPEYRNFFYRTLLPEMKSLGKIVIAITHDDHYFDVADRVVKMKNGQLEEYHNPNKLELTDSLLN